MDLLDEINKARNFGGTDAYIQYVLARCHREIRKARTDGKIEPECRSREPLDSISEFLIYRNERLRNVLGRCRTVLGNMARENEGAWFRRWPINHEPLRSDAKHLLPVVDAAMWNADDHVNP
jgi:hypothetical protein